MGVWNTLFTEEQGQKFRHYENKGKKMSYFHCGKKKTNKIEFYIQQNYLPEVKRNEDSQTNVNWGHLLPAKLTCNKC